jgi:hypothetical protein
MALHGLLALIDAAIRVLYRRVVVREKVHDLLLFAIVLITAEDALEFLDLFDVIQPRDPCLKLFQRRHSSSLSGIVD